MTLEKYITFIKSHERLILIGAGAFLVFHFYGDVLNYMTNRDKVQVAAQVQIAQVAAQKSQADSQLNQQLLQQLADLKLQFAALSAQTQINIAKRAQDTNAQKNRNNGSTVPEIASRTSEVLRVPAQEVTASADGTVSFTSVAAHTNINALEDGIAAEANVVDLNKQLAACVAVTKKQDDTIVSDQITLADEKTSHQADVKLEQANTKLAKDEGKKQFRRGFKWGFITGAVATGTVTIYLKIAHVI